MDHHVEVRKIVLLPRYTSFVGAQTFETAPVNVREFASANISLWVGEPVGTSPDFTMLIEHSPDLETWSTLATYDPTAETETSQDVTFSMEWMRLSITLSGTDPGYTGWCVGNFVTRVRVGAAAR